MLSLARELITRAESDPSHPIPVVFNLTSWTDRNQSLTDWLIDELATKYVIPEEDWPAPGSIKAACGSFFDGLDEVNIRSPGRRRRSDQRVHSGGEPDERCRVLPLNEYHQTPPAPDARRCHTPADPVARAGRDASEEGREQYLETLQLLLQQDSSLQVLSNALMLSMMIRVPGPAASASTASNMRPSRLQTATDRCPRPAPVPVAFQEAGFLVRENRLAPLYGGTDQDLAGLASGACNNMGKRCSCWSSSSTLVGERALNARSTFSVRGWLSA